jgi:hypothetical protein
MRPRRLLAPLLTCVAATAGFAQPNRIASSIDNTRRATLANRIHPLATAANDIGAVAGDFHVPFVTMNFQLTATQQAGLAQLLIDQQNPSSPSYHQWLTP